MSFADAERLFQKLDTELFENIQDQYFYDPKDFRSLVEVLEVLNEGIVGIGFKNDESMLSALKDENSAFRGLVNQRKIVIDIIEEVVTFQHGGLNHSVDTMTDVVKEYNKGREDICGLKASLQETKAVLTSKKSGQISMKELWSKKKEMEESLRILGDLEWLKDTPLRIQRLMQQKRFFNAVCLLNKSIDKMFNEDLVNVSGIVNVRTTLMELKENILDSIVSELRDDIIGSHSGFLQREGDDESDSDDGDDDNKSEAVSKNDSKSVQSFGNQSKFGGSRIGSSMSGSVSNNNNNNNSNLLYSQTTDLMAVDETIEMSIQDVTSSGSLYLRLLVRSIGLLQCEEDAERHILESTSMHFQSIIRGIRDIALSQYKRKMLQATSSETVNSIISSQFTKFISTILDSSLQTLKKLLYILRLLSISKHIRAHSGTEDSSAALLLAFSYEMKETTKKAVLNLWTDIEFMIIAELRMHFVEKDVENISDNVRGNNGSSNPASIKAAGVGIGAGTGANDGSDGEDDKDEAEDAMPIFPPTVKHSAKVYRLVLLFSENMKAIMREGGVLAIQSSSTTSSSLNMHGKKAGVLTVMEVMNAHVPPESKMDCKVLDVIQTVLETELIPVVQSSANLEMREITLNIQHLSLPPLQMRQPHLFLHQTDGIPISIAAQACLRAAKPLFNYWIQLPQHSDMVGTIFDRLVRGFISCAREEIESISWRLFSSDNKYRKPVTAAMMNDPVFKAYRRHVYGGYLCVNDIITKSDSNADSVTDLYCDDETLSNQMAGELRDWGSLWHLNGTPYALPADKIVQDFNALATISAIVHASDWLVMQFIKTCQAACRKLQQIGINHHNNSNGGNNAAGSHQTFAINKTASTSTQVKTQRNEFLEIQIPLWKTVQECTKELSKLSEEGLGLMRAEAQVSSFHFFHKLAHMKLQLTPSTTVSSTSNSTASKQSVPISNTNENNSSNMSSSDSAESIIASLNQHLMKFQTSILSATSVHALASVLSPLCVVIPALLLRCVETLLINNNMAMSHAKDKPKILKMVVSCQQSVVSILIDSNSSSSNSNSNSNDVKPNDKMLQTATEEFEKVRRFVSLMDMSSTELKAYIQNNPSEYGMESLKAVWKHVSERTNEAKRMAFDDMWREVNISSTISTESKVQAFLSTVPRGDKAVDNKSSSNSNTNSSGSNSSKSATVVPALAPMVGRDEVSNSTSQRQPQVSAPSSLKTSGNPTISSPFDNRKQVISTPNSSSAGLGGSIANTIKKQPPRNPFL